MIPDDFFDPVFFPPHLSRRNATNLMEILEWGLQGPQLEQEVLPVYTMEPLNTEMESPLNNQPADILTDPQIMNSSDTASKLSILEDVTENTVHNLLDQLFHISRDASALTEEINEASGKTLNMSSIDQINSTYTTELSENIVEQNAPLNLEPFERTCVTFDLYKYIIVQILEEVLHICLVECSEKKLHQTDKQRIDEQLYDDNTQISQQEFCNTVNLSNMTLKFSGKLFIKNNKIDCTEERPSQDHSLLMSNSHESIYTDISHTELRDGIEKQLLRNKQRRNSKPPIDLYIHSLQLSLQSFNNTNLSIQRFAQERNCGDTEQTQNHNNNAKEIFNYQRIEGFLLSKILSGSSLVHLLQQSQNSIELLNSPEPLMTKILMESWQQPHNITEAVADISVLSSTKNREVIQRRSEHTEKHSTFELDSNGLYRNVADFPEAAVLIMQHSSRLTDANVTPELFNYSSDESETAVADESEKVSSLLTSLDGHVPNNPIIMCIFGITFLYDYFVQRRNK